MKKTLSKKIAEGLAYYVNDTTKRCINETNGCFYSGKTAGKDTDGCFIGRMLKPADRLKADKFFKTANGDSTVSNLIDKVQKGLLKIKLPAIITKNEPVMIMLQDLHDGKSYWGVNCLSQKGKSKLEEIIGIHKLDVADFTEILSK